MMAAEAPITPKKAAYGGAEGSYDSLDIFTALQEERQVVIQGRTSRKHGETDRYANALPLLLTEPRVI